MWPRTDEEKERTSNRGWQRIIALPVLTLFSHLSSALVGFVSFMTRDGAEKAMSRLQDANLKGGYIKLGWGIRVPTQPHSLVAF
jgi:hypothetical protein